MRNTVEFEVAESVTLCIALDEEMQENGKNKRGLEYPFEYIHKKVVSHEPYNS